MAEERTVYIYVLIDPRDNAVRYVGVTVNPKDRLRRHIQAAPTSKLHSGRWISQLLGLNMVPTLNVIDEATEEDWRDRETYWIAKYRGEGTNLTNLTSGGEGVRDLPPETREHVRQSSIKWQQKQRELLGEDVYIAKIRELSRKGTQALKDNPELDEKRKRRQREVMATPEVRAKMGNNTRGIKHPPETIERMRAAAQKRAQDPEWRRKSGEASKARWTPERRAALSIKNKANYYASKNKTNSPPEQGRLF